MKLLAVFQFEIFYQLRRPSTWIFILVLLGLILLNLDDLVENAALSGREIFLNSPISIAEISGNASIYYLLLLAALVGDSVMRDIQYRMDPLIYTTPLKKFSYLGGRFLGILSVGLMLMILIIPLSLYIGSYIYESHLFGPLKISAYIYSGFLITFPNVFLSTAIIFSVVLFSRISMAAYLGALIIFILSTFSLLIAAGNWEIGNLIDPFGITVINAFNTSLLPHQINTEHLGFSGPLLVNRTLWIGISVALGLLAFYHFKISQNRRIKVKKINFREKDSIVSEPLISVVAPEVKRSFNTNTRIFQIFSLAKHFFFRIIKSPSGLAIIVIAAYVYILLPNLLLGPLNVPGLPSTHRVSGIIAGSAVEIIVLIFITLLVGQVIWGERNARIDEIKDSFPISNGINLLGKFLAIAMVLALLQLVLMATGILLQVANDYHHFEIPKYMHVLLVGQLTGYLLLTAAAMAIHVVINQKYVAHMAFLLFYFYTLIPQKFGIEHKMLVFGSDIGWASSAFYSQEIYFLPWLVFTLYWAGWGIILLFVAQQFYIRGRETGFKKRFHNSLKGWKFPPLIIAIVLIIGAGGYIFYNTNILNEYINSDNRIYRQVEYEKLYGQYDDTAQPVPTSLKLNVEFYPDERKAAVGGFYQLSNKGEIKIDSIHLTTSPEVETVEIIFDRNAIPVLVDKKLNYLIYKLNEPLQPGDSLKMSFVLRFEGQGFSNSGIKTAVINNGSFFENKGWLPLIGYQAGKELSGNHLRLDHGLSKETILPAPDDIDAVMDYNGKERINFEVTIGTQADQTAVAPGSLKRTWNEGGRKYFHYVGNTPIINRFPIYSADYELKDLVFKDVEIKHYYHPKSFLNLKSIQSGLRASLDYYSGNFSDYQFDQLKMVEYPDPGTGGIALPGIIGYSTNFALLNSPADTRGFDLPFAVTAHEVAHQWWGHQLTPANTQGAPFLSESLAWYSALNVVEQEYGLQHLNKLLEAIRKDYLNPRSKAAAPLLNTDETFHGYRKGPLVMFALREYIGEKNVNLALSNLLAKFSSGEPPFATSLDLYSELNKVTPDSLHYLLKDLIATNTFWDLKTTEVLMRPTSNGDWLVTVNVYAHKAITDLKGEEAEVRMDDFVEIGVYGKEVEGVIPELYLEKHRLQTGINTINIKVNKQPGKAGIDPRNLLIDLQLDDNFKNFKTEN